MSGDLISRQAVIDLLQSKFVDGFDSDRWWNSMSVLYAICRVPLATPQALKTGHWIDGRTINYTSKNNETFAKAYTFICSECKEENWEKTKFCPNCGARMATDDEIIICEYYRDQGHYKCCYGQKNAPRTNCGGDKSKCEC